MKLLDTYPFTLAKVGLVLDKFQNRVIHDVRTEGGGGLAQKKM